MADLKVDVIDLAGKKAGNVELDSAVFGLEPNIPLLHQVVHAQLAARRAGTAKTKTRGEVSGGGVKPWRQKGTGRARQGSIRAPHWTGGGVVHGPVPRDYSQRTPKKMIAAALRQALSDRAKHDRVHIVKGFVEGDKPSTKVALKFLLEVTEGRKALVVVDRTDDLAILSLRNAQEAHLLYFDQLNAYDVLVADDVVFTEAAYEAWTNKEETK
ncbi:MULTISPECIES: 50S ribosomal protein L4 [Trueperella]|uniref:Large ribosomal subunit protein uL4 n=1 Tax=Trueperella abortisuis TaxID=445930 RepID=A0ABT9PHM2_9ACTO|nr:MULTISPECIES: 50S ribosomal protein L4 [Trueperella]MCI7306336.1 50S ribosomal protein L4 [Trueperella sp.]MDP9831884.1 large subunit ribosomal protein L4 [Trueperella abortisuis]MDY5402776.1 50S ribosomal protein L4 [Trueperella sp.]